MKPSLSRKCIVERPATELIEELKGKITLLESDQVAYYEISFQTMQSNRDKISNLRKEVHDLRTTYWEATHKDEAIVSQAFQNRPIEKSAFIQKSSEVSIEEFDFRVSAAMKRYNYSKYVTAMKEKRLALLRLELVDAQKELKHNMAEKERKTPQLQKIRDLENRVDKLELKGNESEFIQKTYDAIFRRLYEEHAHCNSTLDELELDIVRCRGENAELRQAYKEAEEMRETLEKDLRKQEKFVFADRKRRSIEVARMRTVMETEKKGNERHEKRHLQTAVTDDNPVVSFTHEISMFEETDKTDDVDSIVLCEERIERLCAVTGASDIKSMVTKFEMQLLAKERLIGLINKMEKHIQELREECIEKREQVARIKIAIDCRSEGVNQAMSGTSITSRDSFYQVKTEVLENYANISETLARAKAGLEHIVEKMTHIKMPDKGIIPKPASPEEYMEELFDYVVEKIRILMAELKDQDVEGYYKLMKTEQNLVLLHTDEFEQEMKEQLPIYNHRVRQSVVRSEDEMDSGSDNGSFKNRESMKHDSSQFIEMRLKKRSRRKKNRR